MSTYKVRATITFPDGVLTGVIKVKAETSFEAGIRGHSRLHAIWNKTGVNGKVQITSVTEPKAKKA